DTRPVHHQPQQTNRTPAGDNDQNIVIRHTCTKNASDTRDQNVNGHRVVGEDVRHAQLDHVTEDHGRSEYNHLLILGRNSGGTLQRPHNAEVSDISRRHTSKAAACDAGIYPESDLAGDEPAYERRYDDSTAVSQIQNARNSEHQGETYGTQGIY